MKLSSNILPLDQRLREVLVVVLIHSEQLEE